MKTLALAMLGLFMLNLGLSAVHSTSCPSTKEAENAMIMEQGEVFLQGGTPNICFEQAVDSRASSRARPNLKKHDEDNTILVMALMAPANRALHATSQN